MNHSTAFPGFRLRLTRWGAIYLLALLVLGFAAVNTGNNALMGLLGLALASYAVSGLWSRETLGRTELQVTALPRDVFAGRPVVVEVELHNRSRWFPAYGLVLRDATGRRLLAEALLGPGARCRRGIELEFPARGWTVLGPWTLEVLLPLGFFLKSKRLVQERRILVYPRLLPSATAAPSAAGGGRSLETFDGRGREGEVVQLRPYRDGDDSRQLHWRQTARQQRPIVVDRQRRAAAPVFFVVDPRVSDPDDPAIRERFELMVSEVATGVVRLIERGEPVGLVVGRAAVQPVPSPSHLGRLLRPLAEVQPQRADGAPPRSVPHPERRLFRVEGPA
ncbi:MAG TPA: DUF58 domain-containing protein [Thermoanaerobaculales bacterium]|nr:DUF58 domain-containing protein [Thermoanaerobaculales bacterium]HQL30980.1 DUF58 domain-containing protein [Thermoanaerobaculales bacterium]HQN97287.1 DUF58 domain-containing protein [Thermoanaerobaculales bacterium]